MSLPGPDDRKPEPAVHRRPPPAAPVCRHCGSPVPAGVEVGDFCCAGCAYVYRLVQEQGLDAFYDLRETVTAPVPGVVFEPRDFAWLTEQADEAEKNARDYAELVVDVQGLTCIGCVWLIERLFEKEAGGLQLEVNAVRGQLRLRWRPGEFSAAGFARTLQSFNYLVGPAGEKPSGAPSRELGARLALCAAFALNVMAFALASYFGMSGLFAYAPLFNLVSAVLATLSVAVGGSYFIHRAWRGARDGVLQIDQPIALGILGSYAGSMYGWLAGNDRVLYFDFVTAFILLMLAGRWAQQRAVERNRDRLLSRQAAPTAVRLADGTRVAVERLRSGQVFFLPSGEILPVQSRLLEEAGAFSLAWINGEAEPRTYRRGERVPAGALNTGREKISLEAVETWRESLLAKLLAPPAERTAPAGAFEAVVRGYLVGLLVLAAVGGLGWLWFGHDASRALQVTISVLVVSCPCALGFTLPLADEMAVAALRRYGVFVREATLWPRLARVRQLLFDKTGTLTFEAPVLADATVIDTLNPEARAALAWLVRDNPHPVAQALHTALGGGSAPWEFGPVHEEIGQGVWCEDRQVCWTLGRPGWRGSAAEAASPSAETVLARDGVAMGRFRFVEAARPNVAGDLAALRARGFEIFVLSGDHPAKVAALAVRCGLPPGHAMGGLTPEDKAGWIRAHDRGDTLMLGDGANDSLAFEAAACRGTPLAHRGLLERKADFYYLGRDLAGLRTLFEVAALRQRVHRTVLAVSVAYNLIAVGLALAGLMHPLLAAVLMPLSSLLTLAWTGWQFRRWLKV